MRAPSGRADGASDEINPPAPPQRSPEDEELARQILLGNHPAMRYGRRILARLPAAPRCKLCANPFSGFGGAVSRRLGKTPWPKNPKFCSTCFKDLATRRVGAEIECSLVFADIRGSTQMAESMRAGAFSALMDRFFDTAARVLVRHDAIVDKFVGDEVVAIFIPAMAGQQHARRAIDAARDLLAATSWVPVGAGVNTGMAYVGVVGGGDQADITALGDPVNVTARLASAAGPGEVLVTRSAAGAGEIEVAQLEQRTLSLKGKAQPTEVYVLGAAG